MGFHKGLRCPEFPECRHVPRFPACLDTIEPEDCAYGEPDDGGYERIMPGDYGSAETGRAGSA